MKNSMTKPERLAEEIYQCNFDANICGTTLAEKNLRIFGSLNKIQLIELVIALGAHERRGNAASALREVQEIQVRFAAMKKMDDYFKNIDNLH